MAVAYDTVAPSSSGQTNWSEAGTAVLAAWNHTLTGSNTILLVGVGFGTDSGHSDASSTVTVSCTAGAMTSLAKVHTNNGTAGFVEVFYKVGVTGTQTITVSTTGYVVNLSAGSLSFNGVDQSVPLGSPATNYGSGTTASFASAIASAADNMVVAFHGDGSGAASTVSNATERFDAANNNVSSGCGVTSGATAPGAATVNPSFAITDDWWAAIGVDIKQASAETPKTLNDAGAATTNLTAAAQTPYADIGAASDSLDVSAPTQIDFYDIGRCGT